MESIPRLSIYSLQHYCYLALGVTNVCIRPKCLTKIACELVRGDPQYRDVLDLTRFTAQQMDEALAQVAIEEVFGIGRKYARFLRNYGIATARDLLDADEQWIRKHLTVVGVRIQLELKGSRVCRWREGVLSSAS